MEEEDRDEFSYGNINSCEGRQGCMLGGESFPVKAEGRAESLSQSEETEHAAEKHLETGSSSPGCHDGVLVVSRADVFSDVGVSVTGGAGQRVVGFTDGEEERRVITRRQLDDVSDQSRGTKAEHMHTWT